MKKKQIIIIIFIFGILQNLSAGDYVFSVKGTKTYLNDKEILVAGLRGSNAKWDSLTHKEANTAIINTIKFLRKNDFRNVFVDVDNEGMAKRGKGFNTAEMVRAVKVVDPTFFIATNFHGLCPAEADLGIHFREKNPVKPYIQSEGISGNAKYWGEYSKAPLLENYINIGIYTDEIKTNQIEITKNHFENGWGICVHLPGCNVWHHMVQMQILVVMAQWKIPEFVGV